MRASVEHTIDSEVVMLMSQQHSQEPMDRVFIQNANLLHTRPHHKLFFHTRRYRGEPPTVAGLLLYPDTPAKMETTSQEAFCPKPGPQQERGKGNDYTTGDQISQTTHQESSHSHATSSGQPQTLRQRGRGNNNRERETEEDEPEDNKNQTGLKVVNNEAKGEQESMEMQSQYQKDFPPPSLHCRRTPALPQPDNIAINPSLRIEFRTVQRETYPGWPVMNHRHPGRLRATWSGQPNTTVE